MQTIKRQQHVVSTVDRDLFVGTWYYKEGEPMLIPKLQQQPMSAEPPMEFLRRSLAFDEGIYHAVLTNWNGFAHFSTVLLRNLYFMS